MTYDEAKEIAIELFIQAHGWLPQWATDYDEIYEQTDHLMEVEHVSAKYQTCKN